MVMVSFSRESIKCAINVKKFMSLSEIYIPHLKFFGGSTDCTSLMLRKKDINSHLSCRFHLIITQDVNQILMSEKSSRVSFIIDTGSVLFP